MALYSYKAADHKGKIIQDTLDADSEAMAVSCIQEKGYIPIQVTPAGSGRILNVDLSRVFGSVFNRVSGRDVMLFTQDLATLLEAGLPIDRALEILSEVSEKEKAKELVGDILKIVRGGGYLSEALAKHPGAFSRFFINMVKAGEAGGILDTVLKRLGIFLESRQELKDFIKSALVYPIFLVCVGGLSIVILVTYVIPRFSTIFSEMGSTIPLSTQLLLSASSAFRSYWWLLALLIVAGVFSVRKYIKTPGGRLTVDRLKLKLPVTRDFVQKLEVSRFTRTLGTLLKSGVPMLEALDLVRDIISNRVIYDALGSIRDRVKEGDRLSKPLGASGIFPPLALQMITVGEETARLEEMMLRVAESYESIIKNKVKRLVGLLEPLMILVMGVVVAFIVISMLMAVFSMNEIPF